MRMLQKLILLCLLLTAIAVVPACGKKGPLYLPAPPPPHAPAQAPAPSTPQNK
jgi:predicted small lipoprotein YifL